jgi:hypothetical protein
MKHRYRCPVCGDALKHDTTGRGYVAHVSNPRCKFEKGEKDPVGVAVSSASSSANALPGFPRLLMDARGVAMQFSWVSHDTFQQGIERHWKVDAEGRVDGRSVCWLYCWAKSGMSRPDVARWARRAFNSIFDVSFERFDARVPYAWAQAARYSSSSVDEALARFLTF